jgi:hypothetical protein
LNVKSPFCDQHTRAHDLLLQINDLKVGGELMSSIGAAFQDGKRNYHYSKPMTEKLEALVLGNSIPSYLRR